MIILGLGSNIGDRLLNLREALSQIRSISEITLHNVSPVYESDALLLPSAPESWNKPYLNLAVGISTDLEPDQLLAKTKEIERSLGRELELKWSPRIIDIDILTWNDKYIQTDKLQIPHKDLLERPFVLWPLADIDPDWRYCAPACAESGKFARELIKKFGSRFDGDAPFHTKQIAHRVDTPIMMGVLNLTPNSFSDGGKFLDYKKALVQAKKLFVAGADIIDVGAESTRPGSSKIFPEEEWFRLKPFLDEWSSLWNDNNFKPKLSIDTYKPETAAKLLSYEIDFFNDVGGMLDPKMQDIVKSSSAKVIFMHSLVIPANPQVTLPPDTDIVFELFEWAQKQIDKLNGLGIDQERLIFDVGIGFGKDAGQSLTLIRNIKRFRELGVSILVGHSRKSFLNQFTSKEFAERDLETAVLSGFLFNEGVDYLRIHNVDLNMRLLKINAAL